LARPKLRGTTERFASQLFGTGVTKTNALEALVIAGFVRGLSTRDIEATLVESLGEAAAVSKSTVSRVCEQIKTEFDAWCARRLDEVTLNYLFLDGSHFKYHANAGTEPVLAAWGIDTDGKPVFVGLEAAASESGDAWEGFLTGLGERGLACPLLVISDGAPGLIGAVERTMGAALRQRCLIHRACKELTCPCRGGSTGPDRVEQSLRGGKRLGGWFEGVAVLGEDWADFADDVSDGAAADLEQVGEDVLGAQLALVEHGDQDTFSVGDLLGEHATAGAREAFPSAAAVTVSFVAGVLDAADSVGQRGQLGAAHAGQDRIGEQVWQLRACRDGAVG
jgi:hypothetical protein